ncbi:cell division protein ZapE [Bauldia sp.]|uniref:cell division protein ZapE n=1 Tax=Bauldia sp. TaxID=2575872 RepID=UPI003BAC09F1
MSDRPVSASAGGPVVAHYCKLVEADHLSIDPAQLAVARRLDRLDRALSESAWHLPSKRRGLGWLFARRPPPQVRGLYIHGAVGRGKTMLMDAFFAVTTAKPKRRTHFHAFMQDVHDRIHAFRAAHQGEAGADPITPVAAAIGEETRLLCLDEFAVEDIADAMILARLFTALFEKGLVLVTTSNVAPDDLYAHGLNRPLFLPFVDVLRRHVDVMELDSDQDYRLAKLSEGATYFTPLGATADAALESIWRSLTGGAAGAERDLTVKGRAVIVPRAWHRIARFGFADLCETPLGTGDYAAIAEAFDVVMIDAIPVIAAGRRDVARRFINLIDVFYDAGVRIVVSAAAEPDGLYAATDGAEAAAFRRTASRLIEMRSDAYLAAGRGEALQAASGSTG